MAYNSSKKRIDNVYSVRNNEIDEQKRKEKRTTLCLSILETDKRKLKQKSLDEGKTIAAIIHEWLN